MTGVQTCALPILVNSAPATLDTLKELADALGDDPNFSTTITASIGTISVESNAAFNKANSANVLAQSSYNFANTVNTFSYSSYSQANTANVTAQAAFDKANTAITTSGGSITGQLNVTYTPASTVGEVLTLSGANTKGGTGFVDEIGRAHV